MEVARGSSLWKLILSSFSVSFLVKLCARCVLSRKTLDKAYKEVFGGERYKHCLIFDRGFNAVN